LAPARSWDARSDVDRENQFRLALRNNAIRTLANQKLNRRGDLKGSWIAENEAATIKALAKALSAGHRDTRQTAAEHLALMGTPGTLTLIEYYEHETDVDRAKDLADRISGATSFPRHLMNPENGADAAQAQAARVAAAKVMRILLQQDRATAARDLLTMTKQDEAPEVRRQAAVTLLELRSRGYSSGKESRAWPSDDELQGLLLSSDPLVADAAARSFLGNNPFARPLSPEVLRPLLNSASRGQRDLAVRQLLQPRAGTVAGADVVLPLLTSQYPDVAYAAAQAIFRTESLRRSTGVDSAHRVGLLMIMPCVDAVPASTTPRVRWSTELPPIPPTTVATPAAAPTAALDESSPAATWLWRLTWSTAALFGVAIAGVGLFTVMTVPEPRLVVAKPNH
jgi:hypothetical protein